MFEQPLTIIDLLKTNEKSNRKDKHPPGKNTITPAKSPGPELETVHIIPVLNTIPFVLAYNREGLFTIEETQTEAVEIPLMDRLEHKQKSLKPKLETFQANASLLELEGGGSPALQIRTKNIHAIPNKLTELTKLPHRSVNQVLHMNCRPKSHNPTLTSEVSFHVFKIVRDQKPGHAKENLGSLLITEPAIRLCFHAVCHVKP